MQIETAEASIKRLENVKYINISYISFVFKLRFIYRLFSVFQFFLTPLYLFKIAKTLRKSKPEVIITVIHGLAWIPAYLYAHRNKIPMHIILHDNYKYTANVFFLTKIVDKYFVKIYKYANKRFNVSPYMEKFYRNQLLTKGSVLYPGRASDVKEYTTIPTNIFAKNGSPVMGYAGAIATKEYLGLLVKIGNVLGELGGEMHIFSKIEISQLKKQGSKYDNIKIFEFQETNKLVQHFRSSVDFLFVPMVFGDRFGNSFEINFPSKLTDYTICGLPILIWGPSNSSAVKWANENKEVAMVITTVDISQLQDSIIELLNDKKYATTLAEKALLIGNKDFSYYTSQEIFYEGII